MPTLIPVVLVANLPPPAIRVKLPQNREWLYEGGAWTFAALAVVAMGFWCARRKTLSPRARRVLLWLAAGCVAIAYTTGWLWYHRDSGRVSPNTPATLAAAMPAFWGLGAVIVVVAGWRRVHGNPKKKPTASAGRALLFALVTLGAAFVFEEDRFEMVYIIFLPAIVLVKFFRIPNSGFLAFGVILVFWWVAWYLVLKQSGGHTETTPTSNGDKPE